MRRSPIFELPFDHVFTTRTGGVSTGPFSSLNFGLKWGDDPASVAENRRRLANALGAEVVYNVKQVHGTAVRPVEMPLPSPAEVAAEPADALCTNVPGVAIGVLSADCVGVLMADPETGSCAAAHAGWRGVVGGICSEVIRVLSSRYGAEPKNVRVALGPSIGPCCFEVGPDVAAKFQADVQTVRAGKTYVDLRTALTRELRQCGVVHIDAEAPCTFCNFREFYSYRRACQEGEKLGSAFGGQTGLHMATIVNRAEMAYSSSK